MKIQRILLVDDDRDLIDLWKRYLKEAGYEVDVAYDGVEGLEMAKKDHYSLIVLDEMMPKMDGLAVLAGMNTDRDQGKIHRVVMVTNLDRDTMSSQAMKMGALGCISKTDVDPGAFVERVKSFLMQVT